MKNRRRRASHDGGVGVGGRDGMGWDGTGGEGPRVLQFVAQFLKSDDTSDDGGTGGEEGGSC